MHPSEPAASGLQSKQPRLGPRNRRRRELAGEKADVTRSERPVRDDRLLLVLLSNVQQARARVRRGRALPGSAVSREAQIVLCAELLGALEAYADAASTAGVPLPYRYRDEMSLYRSLSRAGHRPAGRE